MPQDVIMLRQNELFNYYTLISKGYINIALKCNFNIKTNINIRLRFHKNKVVVHTKKIRIS